MATVSTSELPSRQLAIDIEVEPERLDRATEQAYRRIAGRVNVPGFRKGKAPRTMVERMVGRQSIVEDALEHLVPEVVNEAIDQEKVEAYGRPRVESIQMDPLRVRAVVPLPPRVELGDYQADLRIPAEAVQVDPAQVDAVIQRLRESHAQWVPVERAAQIGDRVGIDVRGELAGGERVLMDSTDAEYVVDPAGPQPAEGFAEQVAGMQAGEHKAFTVTLPADHRDRALAGQEAHFTVTLHWVKERQLPDLDEVFAQQAGDYADVDALRAAVEAQIREREEQRVREANEAAALDRLVEISTIEVSPQTVEHQADHMLQTFAGNLERQGLKLEQYLKFLNKDADGFREELRGDAEKRVKRSLALDAFVAAEHIQVEPTEVEAEVRTAAAGAARPEETQMAALGNPETMARVEGALREQKGLTRLVEIATSGSSADTPGPDGRKNLPDQGAPTDTQPTSPTAAADAPEKRSRTSKATAPAQETA